MMQQKILNLNVLLSLLSFFGLYGCAVAVIGIGAAGAGAFAYFNGKMTKTYESEYHDTVRASSATLEDLKIPITETIADALKTEIKAKRTDGTPVAIEILRIEKDLTQVSVRTGSLGVWDKKVSEQIHGYINQNLNRKSIDDQKSSENLAQDDIQPTIGEVVQPEIIEEELEDNSVQETAHTESTVNLGSQAKAEKLSQFSEMTTDSIFIIFFKQNSNDLSEDAIKKLDQVFEILLKNPNTEITLNGYSDSIGAASYNEMISEIRANAVKSYLIGKGITPLRMTAVGHGSQKFLASNKSAEGRQLNRRVEIELINP
jgi:outer membrane protein OmpA-like peptidoglycan-associated protein